MLLLASFTASRPGAIIESRCGKGSKQALQYRDIELMLVSNPMSGERDTWVMKVTFVFMKGDHRSSNPYVQSDFFWAEHVQDWLNLRKNLHCARGRWSGSLPILQFLAIAFADQAFAANDLQSVDQLDNVRVSPSSLPDFSLGGINAKCSCVSSTHSSCRRNTDLARSCVEIWKLSLLSKEFGSCDWISGIISVYVIRQETGNVVNGPQQKSNSVSMNLANKQFDSNLGAWAHAGHGAFKIEYFWSQFFILSRQVRRNVQKNCIKDKRNIQFVRTAAQMSYSHGLASAL